MEIQCSICGNPSAFICEDENFYVYFCSDHSEEHKKVFETHKITQISGNFSTVEPSSQSALVAKLEEIKKETEKVRKAYEETTSNFLDEIKKKIQSGFEEIDDFLDLCSRKIEEINIRRHVKHRKIQSPLEWALNSLEIKSHLSQFSMPHLQSSTDPIPSFIPSNFIHLLSNFSSICGAFKDKNTMFMYPLGKEIKNKILTHGARCMQISPYDIIVTGGFKNLANSAFAINLIRSSYEKLPPLNIGRKFHSISYLDGHLAVIGGSEEPSTADKGEERQLVSVEVFKRSVWMEGPRLNMPKSCASALNLGKITWIIGGWNGSALNTIEKYENKAWCIIDLHLPMPIRSLSLVGLGTNILLLGGKLSGGGDVAAVTYFDTKNMKLLQKVKMNISASFPEQMVCLEENTITLMTEGAKFVKYEI
ncbi:hypothetical protein SteCoe_12965 [Stentor coeruleus]|uniref:B box-type domain-containing protein n=1 Tax=Stentor coeruleus TaxID=5963 RepID=A0A1R2C9K5_9CILI|nr:hypothetical protein SteCoe_12965 [Stentor coeruleus]